METVVCVETEPHVFYRQPETEVHEVVIYIKDVVVDDEQGSQAPKTV
jgi:hypothetical protein